MTEPSRRRPAILVVDDEPAVLAAVARDLRRGFGERYRIVRTGSGDEALEVLGELVRRGEQVALLVADQRMPGLSGTDYLVRAREIAPTAKRVLLTAYADTEAAIQAINEVALDYYLLKPWDPPRNRVPDHAKGEASWHEGERARIASMWAGGFLDRPLATDHATVAACATRAPYVRYSRSAAYAASSACAIGSIVCDAVDKR